MTKSLKELVWGTAEDFDKVYSIYNGKRFYITGGDTWRVRDRVNSFSEFYFSSVVLADLKKVCSAMNRAFKQQ
jgi:hypothetical protein